MAPVDGTWLFGATLIYKVNASTTARMRDELLNETLFFGIDHARQAVAERVHAYNTERPHSALGYQAPAVFAAQLAAMGDQLRATETLRRLTIAPSARQRQIPPRTLVSAG